MGRVAITQQDINSVFSSRLCITYGARVLPLSSEAPLYIQKAQLCQLTDEEAEELNEPITRDELLRAIRSLKPSKAPDRDGLPAVYYQKYSDQLAEKLLEVFIEAGERVRLPDTMCEALVVMIPKAGKDPKLVSSYRPLSMLNIDTKIFCGVLASRLLRFIPKLVHPDQNGFIPKRNPLLNIRRLTHIYHASELQKDAHALVFLDIEQAFDSLD